MQTKPIDPSHFTELHKHIGVALWNCQVLEDALANFITLVLKLPLSRAETEVMEILEKLQSKTMGALIVELRKGNSTNSVTELERRINSLLVERNWLVHKSWRQHSNDLFVPERLPPLLQRLDAMAQEALALQRFFGELVVAWTFQQGITPEQLDAALRQRMRNSGIS